MSRIARVGALQPADSRPSADSYSQTANGDGTEKRIGRQINTVQASSLVADPCKHHYVRITWAAVAPTKRNIPQKVTELISFLSNHDGRGLETTMKKNYCKIYSNLLATINK